MKLERLNELQGALSCFISELLHENNTKHSKLVKRLDDVKTIHCNNVGTECSDSERRLLSLPPRTVGLGIPIFSGTVHFEHTN